MPQKVEYRAVAVQPTMGEGRNVHGVAVRYGDVAPSPEGLPPGISERYERRAAIPMPGAVMTSDHERANRLGRIEWEETDDELRFSSVLPPGARQDQMIEDIRAGLIGGASMEQVVDRERMEGATRVIGRARIRRVSLVTSQAYPESRVGLRESGDADASAIAAMLVL